MRKNEYGPKKGSRKQAAGTGRSQWEGDRANKPKRDSRQSDTKRSVKGRYSETSSKDGSSETRKYRGDESYSKPRRNFDSREEGKFPEGRRTTRRGESPNFRDSRNEPEARRNTGDYKKDNQKRSFRPNVKNRAEAQYKREPIKSVKPAVEVISDSNLDREDRVEGRNSVFEAIRSGRPLNKLFVLKDNDDVLTSRIIAMAREKQIPIQYLERAKLDSISQTRTHQGVILEVAAKEYVEVEDILKIAETKGEQPFLLVLDGITDTNNLGSIIRSAECAGVHGIVLPKRRSASLNATVAKVAAGALEYMPVARVSNLVQTLRSLKSQGLWIIGADMEGKSDYHNTDLKGPTALIIGGEGEGLSRLVKEECDMIVKIPMKGKISSLNAGVAAALIVFEILRQREK